MSTSTSRPPDRPLSRTPGARRRPGLSRVWDRMRAAMKRRSSATAATAATDDGTEINQIKDFSAMASSVDNVLDIATVAHETATASSSSHLLTPSTPLPEKFGMLIPDDDPDVDDEDGLDEISLPIAYPSNSVNHARAQEMFARYGLKYEPRFARTATEPPTKIRRVQRQLKMPARWTCHGCETEFGTDRTCRSCGHRRCNRCSRHPPVSASSSDDGETEAIQANITCQDQEGTMKAVDCALPTEDDCALRITSLEQALREPLEVDTSCANAENNDDSSITGGALLAKLQLSLCSRPRNTVDTVFKPKTQIIRRICHECNTQILPPNRAACQNCGHHRCTVCPRYPPKPEKWPHGSPGDEQPSPKPSEITLPDVQRVYRKPRQRVRYICEHCRTTFAQHENCEQCGHGRCKECIRIPPRRTVPSPAQESPEPILV